MKKPLVVTASILGVVLSAVIWSSCKVTVSFSQTVSGQIVNARSTGNYISGATVTLTDTSGNTYTTSTVSDSSGNWSISSVPAGEFTVQASESGYFFPPMTVSLGGWSSTVPAIPGFQLTTADANSLAVSFILMWDKSTTNPTDLDLDITYPNSDMYSSTDTSANGIFTTPYANISTNWSNGFGTVGTTGTGVNRQITTPSVNPSVSIDTLDYVTHDADSTNGGPETITFAGLPFTFTTPASTGITESSSNGLTVFGNSSSGSALTFAWMGVAEVYINATSTKNLISSSTTSTTVTSATNVVVYAIQTYIDSSGNRAAKLLGIYKPPTDTDIQATSIIRVNMFISSANQIVYQLVPDQQIVPEGGGANGVNFLSVAPVNSVVSVAGRTIE